MGAMNAECNRIIDEIGELLLQIAAGRKADSLLVELEWLLRNYYGEESGGRGEGE